MADNEPPHQKQARARILAPLAAPLLALALVLLFGVDVPHRDAWDSPGLGLLRSLDGSLDPAYFWAQHNEARPLVPRLIFHFSALALGWHPKLFMLLSWAALSAAWLLLWRAGRFGNRETLLLSAWLLAPIQFANLLWGFQLIQVLPIFFVSAAALIAARGDSWPRTLACAALCALASFSNSNGLLSWLVACPAIFCWLRGEKPSRPRLLLFLALAALTGALYARGYQRPLHSPGLLAGLTHPWSASLTVLDGLGGALWSFSKDAALTPAFGLAALALASLALKRALGGFSESEDRADRVAALGPWLALLVFALGSLALMGLGRAGLGAAPGRAGRYASLAVLVLAASLSLLSARSRWRLRVAIPVLLLTLLVWGRGLDRLPRLRRARLQDRLTLRLSEQIPHNPLLGRLHQSAATLAERCRRLRAAGLLDDAPIGPWLRQAARAPGASSSGRVMVRALGPRRWRFEGWAALPDGGPADFVLIVIGAGEPWTGLAVGRWFAGPEAPFGSGLKVNIQVFEDLEIEGLRAFAIDTRTRRAYPVELRRG